MYKCLEAIPPKPQTAVLLKGDDGNIEFDGFTYVKYEDKRKSIIYDYEIVAYGLALGDSGAPLMVSPTIRAPFGPLPEYPRSEYQNTFIAIQSTIESLGTDEADGTYFTDKYDQCLTRVTKLTPEILEWILNICCTEDVWEPYNSVLP